MALLLAACMPARAVDASLTGFGTIGWTASDQPYRYQRFVDEHGTFLRDSVLGAQLDLTLTPALSITLQGRHAASMRSDDHTSGRLSWAFVSWRPDNDWLLRAGRLRTPMYLHSENTDVGTTFDMAHQPAELYTATLLPSTDMDGVAAGWTRTLPDGEFALDGYWGRARMNTRYYLRENTPGFRDAGPMQVPFNLSGHGLVASWRSGPDDLFRFGVHHLTARFTDPEFSPYDAPLVELAPGLSYYKVLDEQPGPTVPSQDRVDYTIISLGADLALPQQWRLISEYSRRRSTGSLQLPRTDAAYLSLQKHLDRWTPYVTLARLRSTRAQLDYHAALENQRASVPPGQQSAEMEEFVRLINLSQRLGASTVFAFDQSSLALGSSYRPGRDHVIKAEWQRVRTGRASQLIDAPAGEGSGGRRINLWSLSYSFVF